jgi:UDP-N-acetylmuramyl pentapeptide phosphotransferase/UDP-N-acetylglucosamine-1-phosphate transferase/CheY-like chemotaxis protein
MMNSIVLILSAAWLYAAKYVLAFGLPLLLALALTPLVRWACTKAGMIDQPDGRRIHTRPVPRGGGLAVFLAFHLSCGIYFLFLRSVHMDLPGLTVGWWLRILPPSILLAVVGIADDRRGLRPGLKLLGQIAACALAVALGVRLHSLLGVTLAPWLDYSLSIVALVAVINAFNLIDGMDGLAAGLAAIASVGMAGAFVLQSEPNNTVLMLILAGACIGFLRYNFNPASVFLGDTGSMFLGFTLASVAIAQANKTTALAAIGMPLLAFGVPFLDTLLALWRRSLRRGLSEGWGVAVSRGDTDHLHHRLARRGLTQRRVSLILYLANAVAIALGLAMMAWRQAALSIFLLAFMAGAYVVLRHYATVELTESGRILAVGLRRPSRRSLSVMLYPVIDFAILSVGSVVLAGLYAGWSRAAFRDEWTLLFPFLVCLPFLSLVFAGTHRRVWGRARISEFFLTGLTVVGGIVVGDALLQLMQPRPPFHLLGHIVISSSLVVPPILTVRALPRLLQDLLEWTRRHRLERAPGAHRVLVYGAGYGYTLLLRSESFADPDEEQPHIVVGLIDDDRNLHGRTVFGHAVLGGIDDLERLIAEQRVTELVISTFLPEERLCRLVQTATLAGVRVHQWQACLRELSVPSYPIPTPAPCLFRTDAEEVLQDWAIAASTGCTLALPRRETPPPAPVVCTPQSGSRISNADSNPAARFAIPFIEVGQNPPPAGGAMRVLIVDDSALIRERLAAQLNELAGIEIVGQAETMAQAISSLRQLEPHAMTLDLRLPDGNGLDVLRLIQREGLPTAVIVLTGFPYPQYEKRARAAGAYAFLNKASDFSKVADKLKMLIPGH